MFEYIPGVVTKQKEGGLGLLDIKEGKKYLVYSLEALGLAP